MCLELRVCSGMDDELRRKGGTGGDGKEVECDSGGEKGDEKRGKKKKRDWRKDEKETKRKRRNKKKKDRMR